MIVQSTENMKMKKVRAFRRKLYCAAKWNIIMKRMLHKESQGESRVRENRTHGLVGGVSVSLNRAAFTLIELLVVIAIIALLVSILLPSLNTARDLAKQVVCLTNLKGMGTAMGMYRSSYDGDNPFLLVSGNNVHIRWAAQLVKEGTLDKSGGVLQCPYSEYKGLSPYSAAGRAQDDGEAYPYCTYIANGGIFPSNSTYMQSLMVPENMANATNTVHIQCCAIDELKLQRDAWMAGMTYYFGFHGAVHDKKALTLFGDSHAQPLDGIEISPNSSTAIYGMYDQIDGMAFNYNR